MTTPTTVTSGVAGAGTGSTFNSLWQGISVIGSAVSAWGQYEEGRTQEEAYKENAKIALQKATYEEEKSRKKIRRLGSEQRLLYSKAGVDITSGSPLLVMAETAAEGEYEAQMIKWGGQTEAEQMRRYGSAARRAGNIRGASTFLSGLSSAFIPRHRYFY